MLTTGYEFLALCTVGYEQQRDHGPYFQRRNTLLKHDLSLRERLYTLPLEPSQA